MRLKRYLLLLLLAGLVLSFSFGPYAQEEVIKIKAWTIGPGPMPVTRATNLEEAVKRLNAAGILPQPVELEVLFSELKWGPFTEKFMTACEAKEGPHIVTLKDIPGLSEAGLIRPVTDYIEKYRETIFYDVYESMLDAVKYTPKAGPYAGEEHYWGIPQDATPGGVWYRKDVLRALGYTDEEIAEMLPSTAEGVTCDLLVRLAREAKEAGLVEWGFVHRPSPGDPVMAYMVIFGGRVYDPVEDKLVLTKSAALKFFQWLKKLVDEGLLSPAPLSWGTLHSMFVEGKILFTFANHVGTPAEWIEKYGLREDFEVDLGFMLFPPCVPGAKPISPLGPLAYLVTQGCVRPEEEHPEAATLLLLFATSADLQARHSVQTMRPPIKESALYDPILVTFPRYQYIKTITPMVGFAMDVPKLPEWSLYKKAFFEHMKAVEAGILTPEKAVEELVKILRADIPDIIIEE